jgi:anhydro-N-acetylmuramic acid kinase
MYHLKKKETNFDISPVNTVLNFYSNQLGFDYDDKEISTTGLINNSLLNELNNLDFINKHIQNRLVLNL